MKDTQSAVLKFLSDPATHGGESVERIDTHAASVFLAGQRALKIKRAVRFPFLDYSTLAKREAACRAEIEVNHPHAPQVYLRVVPITCDAGALAFAGNGEIVEWAIEMRRFDEKQTLDRLAEQGKLNLALADALARVVADAHAKAPITDALPWIASISKVIAQNGLELAEHPDLFAAEGVLELSNASRSALVRLTPLLEERGRLGLIRRCHGDLHLGNIALIDGLPVLFDAIEFDPMIATGDVMYDLAFLLMDLVDRRLPEAANRVLNGYLAHTRRMEDFDALALMPLFLSMRAAIRAKVTAARLPDVGRNNREDILQAAVNYFVLARKVLAPPAPQLIAVGGLSGTGKSVLAQSLSAYVPPVPGAVVLRSDVERKRLFDKAETERLPPEAYEVNVTERVYASLIEKATRVAAAGHSAIVDAVYAEAGQRSAIATAAKNLKVHFRGLFLTAPLQIRISRVGARLRDASDADVDIARSQETYDVGQLDWQVVDASGTKTQTLAAARSIIDNIQAR